MKKEVLGRMKTLTEKFGLNPNSNSFSNGTVSPFWLRGI